MSGSPVGAVSADDRAAWSGFFSKCDALGVEADVDAFVFENFFDGGGDVFVLVGDEVRLHFDDGDLAAEAAVHLAELDADVAAADDDEMLGNEVDLEHGGVGEVIDLVDAGRG